MDLEFIRGLPADSVFDLTLRGEIVPASFSAVPHLAPGLRHLMITLDGLDDDALGVVADLPALESLQLCGGSFTEHGLQRPGGLAACGTCGTFIWKEKACRCQRSDSRPACQGSPG